MQEIFSSESKETSISVKQKAYSVEAIRQVYKKAYAKWSAEEDRELTLEFNQGLSISELAEKHQRKKGAITSRLSKLGVDVK